MNRVPEGTARPLSPLSLPCILYLERRLILFSYHSVLFLLITCPLSDRASARCRTRRASSLRGSTASSSWRLRPRQHITWRTRLSTRHEGKTALQFFKLVAQFGRFVWVPTFPSPSSFPELFCAGSLRRFRPGLSTPRTRAMGSKSDSWGRQGAAAAAGSSGQEKRRAACRGARPAASA